jgi:hypothetical protein
MRRLGLAMLLFSAAACDSTNLSSVPDTGASGSIDSGTFMLDGGSMLPADSGSMIPSDAGFVDSSVLPPDSGTPLPDSGVADAGSAPSDSGVLPDSGSSCDFMTPGAADRDRVMLISHPFGVNAGDVGTEIRSLTLLADGTIRDDGMRLDVHEKPARIAFIPAGGIALVLGAQNTLSSVRAETAGALSIINTVTLPAAGYDSGDLLIAEDGRAAFPVGFNSDASSGISTVHIDCDGHLSVDTPLFFGLRLSESLVFVSGTDRAILLGGQTTFAPVDPLDIRLLQRLPTGGYMELAGFDIFHDGIDAGRIAVSPNGRVLLVPNGSPFSSEGSTVSVIDVDVGAGTLVERRRLTMMDDAREALFSPDGQTALITREEPGKVDVLADMGNGFVMVHEISGIGLPDKMAMVSRGMLSGHVYLPSVDNSAAGSNIAKLAITGPGMVADQGQFNLGSANTEIPDAIAITP